MEIQFYGANCVRISGKKASFVVDDNLAELGLKSVTKNTDIAIKTHSDESAQSNNLTIDSPGEYEVSDVSIRGIAARAYQDPEGDRSATIFRVVADDIRVGVLGHIFPRLNEDQLEAIGTVDILIVPIGNNGYTLDSTGVLELIKAIEPRIVIPTHYADKNIKYPMPQQELMEAIKGLSMDIKDTVEKIKVKSGDITETTELIVLKRQ